MSDVCEVCGLPKDLCMCSTISKEKQQIRVERDKRRYGKIITVITGLDAKSDEIKKIAKQLKSALACGGTVKGNNIELQGNHSGHIKAALIKLGFPEASINVV